MSTFVKGGGGAGEKVKIDGVKVANKMELTSYKGANPLTIGQAGVAFPANTLFLEDFDILNGVSGEDLTETAATQTAAVNALLTMVKRKVAENNGEGEFVWKKLTAEGGDFVDYVISSDSEAYPDGGEQDGYWYELAEEGVNIPAMFGCTKIAVDKFSFSSRKTLEAVSILNHSLAEMPKAIVIASDIPRANADYNLVAAFYLRCTTSDERQFGGIYFMSTYEGVHTYIDNVRFTVTEEAIKIPSGSYTGTTYFEAGIEYTLITMA